MDENMDLTLRNTLNDLFSRCDNTSFSIHGGSNNITSVTIRFKKRNISYPNNSSVPATHNNTSSTDIRNGKYKRVPDNQQYKNNKRAADHKGEPLRSAVLENEDISLNVSDTTCISNDSDVLLPLESILMTHEEDKSCSIDNPSGDIGMDCEGSDPGGSDLRNTEEVVESSEIPNTSVESSRRSKPQKVRSKPDVVRCSPPTSPKRPLTMEQERWFKRTEAEQKAIISKIKAKHAKQRMMRQSKIPNG